MVFPCMSTFLAVLSSTALSRTIQSRERVKATPLSSFTKRASSGLIARHCVSSLSLPGAYNTTRQLPPLYEPVR